MSGRLFKSTAVVGGNTLISRVLGLLRDIIIARYFGAAATTDAFFVAFRIPNFFRRLFAEGAFSQAFVPVLAEVKHEGSADDVRHLVMHAAGTLGGILLLVTIVVELAAPWVALVFGTGFYLNNPDQYALTVDMLRLTFPYLVLISLTALAGAVLNLFGRFAVPAFTPVFLNLSLIGCAVLLSPLMDEPIMALAWGVFIAGVVQLLFQLPFLARLGLLARPRWGWRDSGVRKIMRLMLPAILGSSVVQINLLIDTVIASFLMTGSVTWLFYADRMVEFPLGIFGIALATVILPRLSSQHASADPKAFSATLDMALRMALVIGLPAALGLAILSTPILSTMFEYGEFAAQDVQMAALALMALAIGLPAYILIKILAPGYYARQDTKTPVRIAIRVIGINLVLNLIFVAGMIELEIIGPHAGLALASALAAWFNAGWLYRGLRHSGVLVHQTGWWRLIMQVLLALGMMLVVLLWGIDVDAWSQWQSPQRIAQLAIWVAAGASVYLLVLWLSGLRLRHLRG